MTREELYNLVWSTPASTAAVWLGISDVYLGRVCRSLDVPKPPRGYAITKPKASSLPDGAILQRGSITALASNRARTSLSPNEDFNPYGDLVDG